MNIPKNRDELETDAKELAVLTSDAFSDDWIENTIWTFLGFVVGYVVRWMVGG